MVAEFNLDSAIRQQIIDHVQSVLPQEGCGLLAGKGLTPCHVQPVTNKLHSPVLFEMEPQELLKAMFWAEENGLDIVAIYHSHPSGPAVPSPTDIAKFAYPEVAYLILSRQPPGLNWQIRAFQICKEQFTELYIIDSVNNSRPGGK